MQFKVQCYTLSVAQFCCTTEQYFDSLEQTTIFKGGFIYTLSICKIWLYTPYKECAHFTRSLLVIRALLVPNSRHRWCSHYKELTPCNTSTVGAKVLNTRCRWCSYYQDLTPCNTSTILVPNTQHSWCKEYWCQTLGIDHAYTNHSTEVPNALAL